MAAYRAIAIGDPAALTDASDVEAWWASKDGDVTIKTWYETATKVMLLQPSSAAAERVFSMLKALMGDQQASKALQDYQQAALMIHYNGAPDLKRLLGRESIFANSQFLRIRKFLPKH